MRPTKAYREPANRGPINLVALFERVSIASEVLKRFFLILSANTRLLTARSTTQVIPFIKARINAKITLKWLVKTKITLKNIDRYGINLRTYENNKSSL